jgi:hypothetical protein
MQQREGGSERKRVGEREREREREKFKSETFTREFKSSRVQEFKS